MEVSELTLKLIILLIPGALASFIFEKLTIHKKWDSFKFIANSIIFGTVSYILAQLLFSLRTQDPDFINFWKNLQTKEIHLTAVIKAIVVSLIIGFACAGLDNYKCINRVGKFFHLSTKYGDENLYSYFLTLPEVTEVFIHDIPNNITYFGVIDSYSETEKFKEIYLNNVKVYQYDTANFCYGVEKVYLSRPIDNIVIEVPNNNNKINKNEQQTETQAT